MGDATETHAVLADVRVTLTPPLGAAICTPWLSRRTVNVPVRPCGKLTLPATLFRAAVTETLVDDEPYPFVDAVTVAPPGSTPLSVAFADSCPAGIVTVAVTARTLVVSELVIVSTRPPAGAGAESEMGSDAVPP